jgi:hypothetical protein
MQMDMGKEQLITIWVSRFSKRGRGARTKQLQA